MTRPRGGAWATLTLTEFLLARIAEDDAAASESSWVSKPDGGTFEVVSDCDCSDDHASSRYLAIDPARVLAECAAKRAIIKAAQEALDEHQIGTAKWLRVLDALAEPYSGRPA